MDQYTIDDLKLVYRTLHRNIKQHLDLLDSELFSDLQRHLQKQAQDDGVDVSDHGAWDAWLGNEAVSCEVRMVDRELME